MLRRDFEETLRVLQVNFGLTGALRNDGVLSVAAGATVQFTSTSGGGGYIASGSVQLAPTATFAICQAMLNFTSSYAELPQLSIPSGANCMTSSSVLTSTARDFVLNITQGAIASLWLTLGTGADRGGSVLLDRASAPNGARLSVLKGWTLTVPPGSSFTTASSSQFRVDANALVGGLFRNLGALTLGGPALVMDNLQFINNGSISVLANRFTVQNPAFLHSGTILLSGVNAVLSLYGYVTGFGHTTTVTRNNAFTGSGQVALCAANLAFASGVTVATFANLYSALPLPARWAGLT